jgi:hypothetical protein
LAGCRQNLYILRGGKTLACKTAALAWRAESSPFAGQSKSFTRAIDFVADSYGRAPPEWKVTEDLGLADRPRAGGCQIPQPARKVLRIVPMRRGASFE